MKDRPGSDVGTVYPFLGWKKDTAGSVFGFDHVPVAPFLERILECLVHLFSRDQLAFFYLLFRPLQHRCAQW